jgi:hypothetical protein
MTVSLPLLLLSLFSLIFFVGCTSKSQSIACFKGSPACYSQNINTDERSETVITGTKTACTNCFIVL